MKGSTTPQGASGHPSFLALDRHALGASEVTIARHVARCPRCQEHVSRVAPSELSAPAWVRPAEPRATVLSWLRGHLTAGLRLAAAAGVVIAWVVAVPRLEETHSGLPGLAVRTKGASLAVTLYAKRGDRVDVWSGQRVASGDALAIALSGARRVHVVVLGGEDAGAPWKVLWRGSAEVAGELMLPVSFTVDGNRSAERLAVIVADEPLNEAVVERLRRDPTSTMDGVETRLFTLETDSAP